MDNSQDSTAFYTEVLQIKTLKWLQDNRCGEGGILLQALPFVDVARNKLTNHKADVALISDNKLHSYHVIPDKKDEVTDQFLETLELAAKAFDTVSITVTPINREEAIALIPPFCGVLLIDGGGTVSELRPPKTNTNETKAIVNLLTKSDLIKAYNDKGLKGITGHAKPILLEFADDYLTTDEAKEITILSLLSRHTD